MNICNSASTRGGIQATAALFSLVLSAAASADEAPSDGFYVGGLVGVGAARSFDRGILAESGLSSMDGLYVPSPPMTGQSGDAAPSLSLVFGAIRSVTNGFSAGLEFEGEYQGARARSSGSFYVASQPLLPFEETHSLQTLTRWSVPAQAALRARASFQIAPSVWIFGSLGPTLGYARFRATFTDNQNEFGYAYTGTSYQYFDTNSVYAASAGKSFVDLGISLNAGMEVAIAPNISLRGEYAFAAFSSIVEPDPWGFATARATPLFQDIRLGIVRHF